MGIYGGVRDVASDSIPIFLVVTAAGWVSYLRSLIFLFLQSIGLFLHSSPQECQDEFLGVGLARMMALSEELQRNPTFGYVSDEGDEIDEERGCVVCLCRMREGEEVRKLGCSHVFHRSCLDGWLGLLKMNCPLCRAPISMVDEHLKAKERQVSHELLAWFS